MFYDENLLKRLHNNYFSNAIDILNEINPKRLNYTNTLIFQL